MVSVEIVFFAFKTDSSSIRGLIRTGFTHSAFTFAYESLVIKSSAAQTEIPPGALITFLQKGLEYIAIEEHIAEVRNLFRFVFKLFCFNSLCFELLKGWYNSRIRQ